MSTYSYRNNKTVGDISEAALQFRLMQNGWAVSKPFGENQSYDLLIDSPDTGIKKVQCKTARVKGGTILCEGWQRTQGKYSDVDFCGMYCPDNDLCYLVPADIFKGVLRFAPPANGQYTAVPVASYYELSHKNTKTLRDTLLEGVSLTKMANLLHDASLLSGHFKSESEAQGCIVDGVWQCGQCSFNVQKSCYTNAETFVNLKRA